VSLAAGSKNIQSENFGRLRKSMSFPPQFNINGFGLPPPPLGQTLRKTTLLGYTGGFGNSGHAILSGILF